MFISFVMNPQASTRNDHVEKDKNNKNKPCINLALDTKLQTKEIFSQER
jgi:hypothetical protein